MAVKKPKKNLKVILLVVSLVIALVVIVGISSFASVGTSCVGPSKETRKTMGNHGISKLPPHKYEEYRTRKCLTDKQQNIGGIVTTPEKAINSITPSPSKEYTDAINRAKAQYDSELKQAKAQQNTAAISAAERKYAAALSLAKQNTSNGTITPSTTTDDRLKFQPVKSYWSGWGPWIPVSHKEPPILPAVPSSR